MTQPDSAGLYLAKLLWDQPARWNQTRTVEPFPDEWVGVTLDFIGAARTSAFELDQMLIRQAKRASAPPKQCRLVVRAPDGTKFTWQLL